MTDLARVIAETPHPCVLGLTLGAVLSDSTISAIASRVADLMRSDTETITRLTRQLDEARARVRWQPIETAPRDGTDFLGLIPFRAKHHQMVGCFAPNGFFMSWPGRHRYEPSHWQPLPPLPLPESSPTQAQAFAALCDPHVPVRDALRLFERAARRTSDINKAFDLHVAGLVRMGRIGKTPERSA